MPQLDFRTPRLYVDVSLREGETVALDREQSNYLLNVLRLETDDDLLLFNGRDGEWRGRLVRGAKRALAAQVQELQRGQPRPLDLVFMFAPLKHARLDYLVQKAVEMGASRLQPVITRHTQVARVNVDRMRANVIEAAQQCGILNLAQVSEPAKLSALMEKPNPERLLVFCDESAEVKDPIAALMAMRPTATALLPAEAENAQRLAVLIGPEGGFDEHEREMLLKHPNVVQLALGPRILRADTAAVAALALVQSALGDWGRPSD